MAASSEPIVPDNFNQFCREIASSINEMNLEGKQICPQLRMLNNSYVCIKQDNEDCTCHPRTTQTINCELEMSNRKSDQWGKPVVKSEIKGDILTEMCISDLNFLICRKTTY